MMRILPTAVAILIALTAPLAAQGGGGMGGPPLGDDDFPPTVAMLTTMLDLTAAQAERVRPFRDSLLLATRDARAGARAARDAMQSARRAGVGADSLAALRAELQHRMMGLMPFRMQFLDRVRTLLTPAQQRTLDARREEMLGRMGEMVERHEQ